ncbi:hypothetical protein V6N13_055044 [Hibiscus sabdariffa]|uniref:Uncharacterized protein n=2 Tax=Hibiscus sabdariffa TaxID=183260 RepID=A0ABR1ZW23_9ROSI
MKFGSKVRSFVDKLRRCNKLKYYYFRYQRLVEHHLSDDETDDGVGGAPRIYVSVTVGEEAKSYDVPLMYLSLPWFREMVIRPNESDLETDLGRPIAVDCSPEMFELFLELWSFKWDFNEGNYFMFLRKFEKWSRGGRDEYSTSGNADADAVRRTSDEMSISSSDSVAES